MTGFVLRNGLSFCRPEGRAVFLDLEADRYFGLAPSLDKAFTKLVETGEADPQERQALLKARVIVPSTETNRPAPCSRPSASTTAIAPNGVRASIPSVTSALIRRAIWQGRIKRLPLAQNIQSIEQRKQAIRPIEAAQSVTARLHQAYHRASMIISARDQCLATSLSLASWLIASGIRPDLLLGVKLNPFQAHCWVEVDGVIVGDDPEQVRPFTPIRTS